MMNIQKRSGMYIGVIAVLCILFFVSGENKKNSAPENKPIIPRWEKGDMWVVMYRHSVGVEVAGMPEEKSSWLSDEEPYLYKVTKADPIKEKEAMIEVYEILKENKLQKVCSMDFHYTEKEVWFQKSGGDGFGLDWVNYDKKNHIFIPISGEMSDIILSFPSFPLYRPKNYTNSEQKTFQIIKSVEIELGWVIQSWEKGKKWWSKAVLFSEHGNKPGRTARLAGKEETKKILKDIKIE